MRSSPHAIIRVLPEQAIVLFVDAYCLFQDDWLPVMPHKSARLKRAVSLVPFQITLYLKEPAK